MKWNVGTKIGAGFCVALAIFVIVSVVSYRATTELIEATDSRRQSYELLSQLHEVFSLMQDIEIGQRSYALTGEDRKSTRLNSSHIQKSRMPSSA